MGASGLKLAYFSQGYSPHDLRFIRAFTELGLEVLYLQLAGAIREKRPCPPRSETMILTSQLGQSSPSDLQAWEEPIRQRLAGFRPDVLLAGPLHTGGCLASRVRCAPLVAMSHGFDLLHALPSSVEYRQAIRDSLQGAQAFFADCPALLEFASQLRRFDAADTVCLPWGIDQPIPHAVVADGEALRRSLGWEQATVLLSLRAWEPLYAVLELVTEFAQCARSHPELRLILGGDGSQRTKVDALIRELGLEDRIHRPGYLAEERVWNLLGAADVYVSSSRSDGSSISLLQAMAAGRPVLVQDTGGNRDWVAEDVHGWFFAIDEAGSFDKALRSCLRARGNWRAMGDACAAKVAAEANWHDNRKRLVSFLEKVARQGVDISSRDRQR